MRYSADTKNHIGSLRQKGYTYSEINARLGLSIPSSTYSYLCRAVLVSAQGNERLKSIRLKQMSSARKKAIIANRDILTKRLKYHSEVATQIVNRTGVDGLKVALALLYWGEGSKWKYYRGLSLGSSDADMLLTYIYLLEFCYGLSRTMFKCRLILRADQDAIDMENYWSKTLDIPGTNFYKTYFDQRTVGKITKKTNYKGVCVVSCAGTNIQLELDTISKKLLHRLETFSQK